MMKLASGLDMTMGLVCILDLSECLVVVYYYMYLNWMLLANYLITILMLLMFVV